MVELWRLLEKETESQRALRNPGRGPCASSSGQKMDVRRDRTAPTPTPLIGPPWARRCRTCSSTKRSEKDCIVKAINTNGGAPSDSGGKGKEGRRQREIGRSLSNFEAGGQARGWANRRSRRSATRPQHLLVMQLKVDHLQMRKSFAIDEGNAT